jgi:glycosyltransferase involved in cell wall biosynthesis
MKILFLTHQFFPEYQTGTERFVLNNAIMAQKFGNKVKVITYSFYENAHYDNESHGILYKEFFYEGIPVLAFKYKEHPPYINLILHNNLLYGFAKAVLEREFPDSIHVGHPMRVHEFIWAAKDMEIPYIITLTDFFLLCPKVNLAPDKFSLCAGPLHGKACADLCPEFNQSFILNRIRTSEEILKNAKSVISPSDFVANIFRQEYPDISIQINPHGLSYKNIRQNKRKYKQEDNIVFGYAGSLIYHKGVHVLTKAFSKIKSNNTKLYIYGSGEEKYLNFLKEILRHDNRVTFHGKYNITDLGDLFSSVDVLVTPSVCYENYLLVLHEALASNVPVIASKLGVMSEKIKENFNGFTFLPGDINDLALKMETIINNPTILNDLKQNIKNLITIPTIEQEAYAYIKIYKNNHS